MRAQDDVDNRLPNLFIIGAPKCGTTAAYHAVGRLPEVTMSDVKEPGFFSNEALYPLGLEYYRRSYFPHRLTTEFIGEATPWYLYSEQAAQRIANDVPGPLTLIALLRNPTDRAISMYIDQVGAGLEKRSPEEALDRGRGATEDLTGNFQRAYFQQGSYTRYLKVWRSIHGDALHVVPAPTGFNALEVRVRFERALGLPLPATFLEHVDPSERNGPSRLRFAPLFVGAGRVAGGSRMKLAMRSVLPPGFDQKVRLRLTRRARTTWTDHLPKIPASLVARLDDQYAEEVQEVLDTWAIDLRPDRDRSGRSDLLD